MKRSGFRMVQVGLLTLGVILCCSISALGTDTHEGYGTISPLPGPLLNPLPSPGAAGLRILAEGPSFEELVVDLVNEERWNNGALPPLKQNSLLDLSAETHSYNMGVRNFFAHCDLDTATKPWDRMTAAGYQWSYAGENIAAGYSTPEEVMTGWMNSSGHRANILSTSFREIGVGYYYDSTDSSNVRTDSNGDCAADGTYSYPLYRYWTQNFGARYNVYPLIINREAYKTQSPLVNLYIYGAGWATEMRLRNEDASWGGWQPFSTHVTIWELSIGNGLKEVNVEIRNASGTVLSASDTILLEGTLPPPAPSPPGGVSATDGLYEDKVSVSWSTSIGATYYEVYRAEDVNGVKSKVANVNATTYYDDMSAQMDVHYFYWVKACNGGGCSNFSEYDIGYLKTLIKGGVATTPMLMLLLD